MTGGAKVEAVRVNIGCWLLWFVSDAFGEDI
jgi:hypothetical protein